MRNRDSFILFVVCIGSVLLSNRPGAVLAQQQGTSFLFNIDIVDEEKLDTAIQANEELLTKYPESEFAPTVMFQLCELYARKADLEYQRRMSIYEQDLDKHDKGLLTLEPIEPRISFQRSIAIASQLLERFPKIPFKDRVLYRLALSHMDEGNYAKGKEYFEGLIAEYPESPIVPEAHFRIGEFFFERREFQLAIDHYSKLLQRWDSPYFDLSLYKLGWAYYNINNYAEAISYLIYLIDDATLLETTGSVDALRSKSDLRKEAIDYIAISFTEYGGPARAKDFLESRKDKDYVILIFQKIADVYNSRDFYAEAILTYQTLLELYPFYHEAPRLYRRIIETYEAAEDVDKANEAREELVRKFGPGSSWLAQYPEGEIRNEALQLAQSELYELGTYYQALGQENTRSRDYRRAIDNYAEYLLKFPQGEKKYTVNYYLAECLYEVQEYEAAAEAYYQCMTKYEEPQYRENSAYNRILCYYHLCQNNAPPDTVTTYIDDFLGSGALQSITVAHGYQAQLLEACNDYDHYLPGSSKHHEVLMKLGETLYDLGEFDLSVQAYQKVANDSLKSIYSAQAMTMIAQSYFKNEQYGEAERWYGNIAVNFADSTEFVETANRMIASSRFKMAELLKAKGEELQAATEFERLTEVSTDDEVTQRALYEAAILYEKTAHPAEAIALYEQLATRFPKSAFADEALFKAGVIRQSLEQWGEAAGIFVRLADVIPSSKYVHRALYNAGSCYENIQDWGGARQAYQRYSQLEASNPDEYLEVLFKIADMAYQNRDTRDALQGYAATVGRFHEFIRQGRLVDDYTAAHAQFMVGEIHFQSYSRIDLVPPLEKNLKLKQDMLRTVLEAYKDAAKFSVAEWATASTYKIGMAFEEFVRAFLESPRPENATDEELAMYNRELTGYAEPFKVQALNTYKANVQRAEESNIDNQWVAESRKRMQQLLIELGPGANSQLDTSSTKSTKGER